MVDMTKTPFSALMIRRAVAADKAALEHLAELDCASRVCDPVLLAEQDGRAVAALSLNDGTAIADPFKPTADIVALLRFRARQLAR
jgi:hypothetical protein